MNFAGKTALITGAASGIGRATAITFAQNGARVVIADIDMEKLEGVKKEIEEYTKDVLAFKCNVSDEKRVYEVVAEIEKVFEKVDILINNAAVFRCWNSFLDTPNDEWRKYIDVNIMGVVYFTKAVLPKMLDADYGRIINIASVAGVYGNANMAHYSATKGAVISMTKALAKEVADKGVLVNSVSPGMVSGSENPDMNYTAESNLAKELTYMGRTGAHQENANLICFLASDEASFITGQNIQIDGCRRKI